MQPQKLERHRVWIWLRQNLFNTRFNSFLTLVCLGGIIQAAIAVVSWITTQAQWQVITRNLPLFLVGRYPVNDYWRLWLVLALLLALVGGELWQRQRQSPKLRLSWLWPIAFVVILWLIGGGWGLTPVRTNLWNGLLLTLLLAVVSLLLAFPLGIVLALGRQSPLPLIQGFSSLYIEILRGLPLIGILFMAQVMLPLILPGGARLELDRILRAIAGLALFNAAYLAENIRGGLQAIPRGQIEAAKALGLNPPLRLGLIILPQALRIAIPGIVGQFISLFKDTSLLSLFALVELTGIARTVLAQPQFLGRYGEVYLFVGLIYWLFCYAMSLLSRRWERLEK